MRAPLSKAFVASAILAVTLSISNNAWAEPDAVGDGDTAVFHDHNPGSPDSADVPHGGGSHAKYFRYPEMVFWPETSDFCVVERYTTNRALATDLSRDFVHQQAVVVADGGSRVGTCPGDEVAATPDVVSISGQVEQYWKDRMVLVHPTIKATPTNAITGVPVFLSVDAELSTAATLPDPVSGLNIRIEATSVYDIDWGDGKTDHNLAQTSNGYPNGIRHSYQTDGVRNISLTQHWHLVWFADRFTGTIDTLFTTAQINGLRVSDAEAVLRN